jgi:hypothetical protein
MLTNLLPTILYTCTKQNAFLDLRACLVQSYAYTAPHFKHMLTMLFKRCLYYKFLDKSFNAKVGSVAKSERENGLE